MTPREFCTSAFQWVQSTRDVRSSVVACNPQENELGIAEIPVRFVTASSASRWGYGGLWMLTLGTILAMTALPGMPVATKDMLHQLGYGALLIACGCLVAAEIIRRRHLIPALLELRAASAGVATVHSIERLHARANGSLAWVIAESGLARGALTVAKARNIRCFERTDGDFRELDEEPLAPVIVDPRLADNAVPSPRRRRTAG